MGGVDIVHSLDEEDRASHPCAEFPPLVALRELQVHLGRLQTPPRWSANLLTAITSAPGLSSIRFGFGSLFSMAPGAIEGYASDDRWMLIDSWLARLAEGRGQRPALAVVLSIPSGGGPEMGRFLSGCRGVGVEVVINPG